MKWKFSPCGDDSILANGLDKTKTCPRRLWRLPREVSHELLEGMLARSRAGTYGLATPPGRAASSPAVGHSRFSSFHDFIIRKGLVASSNQSYSHLSPSAPDHQAPSSTKSQRQLGQQKWQQTGAAAAAGAEEALTALDTCRWLRAEPCPGTPP